MKRNKLYQRVAPGTMSQIVATLIGNAPHPEEKHLPTWFTLAEDIYLKELRRAKNEEEIGE